MNNVIEHNGYYGKFGYVEGDEALHGVVININDVIHFQGQNIRELKDSFRDSIEDYLAWCKEDGVEPDKPFSGKFVVRMDSDLHRRISLKAQIQEKSLNQWMVDTIEEAVS